MLCGFFAIIGISEFYNVAIKKDTEYYPFGSEGSLPYYYKTAELYSYVNLTYGIAFGLLLLISIWNWKKNGRFNVLLFAIICLMVLLQFIQGWNA